MSWLNNHWLDVVGWGGSAILVYSLLQTHVHRFRTHNLLGCVILLEQCGRPTNEPGGQFYRDLVA